MISSSNCAERLVLNDVSTSENINLHVARYEFAKKYISGKIVMDIACGSGYGTAALKKSGATYVLGVDISDDAIKYALKHYLDKNIDFKIGSAEKLSSFGKYDVIVSFETIEHIEHPDIFLSEVKQTLTSDGILIISTPVREYGTIEDKPNNMYHRQEWSENEFQELLRKYFLNVDIYGQYNFRRWFPYSRKLKKLFFKIFLHKYCNIINFFPVLTTQPKYAGFHFDMIYIIAICSTVK